MRSAIFTRPDGSQILVTLYPRGRITVAERPDPLTVPVATWGPPISADFETHLRPVEDVLNQHGRFI